MNSKTLRKIAFILASTNHGTLIVNRNDYRIVEAGGYGVGYQLLNQSAFDPEEVSLALQLLAERKKHFGDGVVAVDCGANIGVHTIEWAQFMHNWGQVLAFEAQERIYYSLAGNIAINNCFNARASWAAIGKENSTIKVPQPNYLVPSSFGSLELIKKSTTEYIGQEISYSDEDSLETQMLALDDLKIARLDLIKIDIEGMEMDALLGAKDTIKKCQPNLIIEKIKSNEGEIQNYLKDMGYRIFPLGINILAIHQNDPTVNNIRLS